MGYTGVAAAFWADTVGVIPARSSSVMLFTRSLTRTCAVLAHSTERIKAMFTVVVLG
jgi:hypothetical protein